MADVAPRDANRNVIIQAASEVDGISPVNLWADPTTHELLVSASVSIAANSSINLNQIAGTSTAVNNGTVNNGTIRVTVASDSSGTLAVTNAGLTELAAAINGSSQLDVNIAASGVTVPVSNAGLTALNGAISGSEVQVDVLSVIPGGGETNLGKVKDTGSSADAVGVYMIVTRRDTATNEVGNNADYTGLQVNNVGRLWTTTVVDTALPAGNNNIGDVDIASSALPAGASTLAEQQTQTTALGTLLTSTDFAAAFGTAGTADTQVISVQGIASMTPVQVSQATASNLNATVVGTGTFVTQATLAAETTKVIGTINVAAGQTIAVTNAGTFAVQDATAEASLSVLDDWDETNRAAVNTIAGQVGVQGASGTVTALTQRVVLATDVALPAGTNNIGDVDIVSGTITTVSTVTALGAGTTGPMKAEDAGHTTGDQGFPAWGVRNDSPDTALSGTNLDYSVISTTSTGAIRTAPMSEDFAVLANGPQVKKYYTNAGAVTDGIVWSPGAGKRWYVTDITINVSAATVLTLEDDLGAGDSPVAKFEFAANSGWSHAYETPLFSGEDAADLLVTTTAGNVYITVVGYEI